MGERRGLSHIEFVISFVIFVVFIAFAFMFFSPLQSNRTLKSTLDYAWLEVDDATKNKLETYSVFITSGASGGDEVAVIIDVPNDYNASVEDIEGKLIDSYKSPNGAVHFSNPDENFVRIKYSPVFPNGAPINGTLLGADDYSISSSEVEELHFERLFDNLNKSYFSNYTALKKKFNLPNRMNFGFVAKFNETYEITALRNIPEESEVLSKNERFQAVSKSGIKKYVDVRVLVW
ncbi:MAG: hypothetical protein AABX96_00485 [Nanoarchaeota archaeon]